MAAWIASRDPDRHFAVHGLRGGRRLRERPELALVGVVAGPEILYRRNDLAHALPGGPGVEARDQPLVFKNVGAAGDTEVQSAVGGDVRHRRLARELDRVPER